MSRASSRVLYRRLGIAWSNDGSQNSRPLGRSGVIRAHLQTSSVPQVSPSIVKAGVPCLRNVEYPLAEVRFFVLEILFGGLSRIAMFDFCSLRRPQYETLRCQHCDSLEGNNRMGQAEAQRHFLHAVHACKPGALLDLVTVHGIGEFFVKWLARVRQFVKRMSTTVALMRVDVITDAPSALEASHFDRQSSRQSHFAGARTDC
jgi:hypothetical protein